MFSKQTLFNFLQVAVVNSIIPVADVVGPPLAGLVADKIGNFRFVHILKKRTKFLTEMNRDDFRYIHILLSGYSCQY